MLKVFEESKLEEIKRKINDEKREDYEILDSYSYGDFLLDISFYEKHCDITISLWSIEGCSRTYISKEKFLAMIDEECGLEKYLNEAIFYNLEEN